MYLEKFCKKKIWYNRLASTAKFGIFPLNCMHLFQAHSFSPFRINHDLKSLSRVTEINCCLPLLRTTSAIALTLSASSGNYQLWTHYTRFSFCLKLLGNAGVEIETIIWMRTSLFSSVLSPSRQIHLPWLWDYPRFMPESSVSIYTLSATFVIVFLGARGNMPPLSVCSVLHEIELRWCTCNLSTT